MTISQIDQSQAPGKRRRAVLLINLGTPDAPDASAVRRYLTEFLTDPEVIRFPRGFGWLTLIVGRFTAFFRAKRSAEMYRRIWTEEGSPLRVITDRQAQELTPLLPNGWCVFSAMRYGTPSIANVLDQILDQGIHEVVAIPMYPQFSGPTTRTALRALYSYTRSHPSHLDLTIRSVWYDDAGYINSQAKHIHSFAEMHGLAPEDTYLLFSVHSLPAAYVRRGDPYPKHIDRTRALVLKRLGWPEQRSGLSYQSRLGPVEWLQPSTEEMLQQLGRAGEKNILVCPLSFTTDCLETLEEVGMRCREQFEADDDGRRLYLCPALNTFEPFLTALRHLVLFGRHTLNDADAAAAPLLRCAENVSPPRHSLSSLFMVGVSLPGRIAADEGPSLRFTNKDQFRQIKKPQCEVVDFLRQVRSQFPLQELMLLNNFQRFELYAILRNGLDEETIAGTASEIGRLISANAPVNVLRGPRARHHLARTAAGMNSNLPGESDVARQLKTACRLSEQAGTAGPLLKRVVDDVVVLVEELREHTGWGRLTSDYCGVAITRLATAAGLDLPACRVTVIGGSTTSCGILHALINQCHVSSGQLTLLHRGHAHGNRDHMKMLRRAIAQGRRLRVQSYADPQVLRIVADSEVVFFGTDSQEPILDFGALANCRDFRKRPLTIVDFNMNGSMTARPLPEGVCVWTDADLEKLVDAQADEMTHDERFIEALRAAESWIKRQVLHLKDEAGEHDDRPVENSGQETESHSIEAESAPCVAI